MKRLFKVAALVLIAGIAVATSGCYVVHGYHEVGLRVGHRTGYGHHHHHHHHRAPVCPPHGW